MKFSILEGCRICRSYDLEEVFKVGSNVALSGYFPDHDETDTCGPLTVLRCKTCGLSQLRETYPLMDMYGQNYGYQSGLNESMVKHLARIAGKVTAQLGYCVSDPIQIRVMDIGSNDGTLLNKYPNSWHRVGIDPILGKWIDNYEGCEAIPEFFSLSALDDYDQFRARRFDAITSIAMFYDLPDPVGFARQIYECLTSTGFWILEVGYLPNLFAQKAFDSVCHEHLEYYRLQDLVNIADMTGFKITNFEFTPTNGGSILATLRKKGEHHRDIPAILKLEQDSAAVTHWRLLPGYLRKLKEEIFDFLYRAECPAGYGASTKGNILLQYFGITSKWLPHIAEINPDKFGKRTPGTRIPIIEDSLARVRKPSHWFVLPWHFRENIEAREDIPCFFPLPWSEDARTPVKIHHW